MNADQIRTKLRTFIVEQMLGGDGRDLADDTDLVATGVIDSFSMVRLLGFVSKQIGVELDMRRFDPSAFQTIDAITAAIERQSRGDG